MQFLMFPAYLWMIEKFLGQPSLCFFLT
jgi:hypothetical protein